VGGKEGSKFKKTIDSLACFCFPPITKTGAERSRRRRSRRGRRRRRRRGRVFPSSLERGEGECTDRGGRREGGREGGMVGEELEGGLETLACSHTDVDLSLHIL
jgi:hypothetical protein